MNESAGQVRYDITANAESFLEQLRAAGNALDDFGDRVSEQDKQLIREWNNLADEMYEAIDEGARQAVQPIVEFCGETVGQFTEMISTIGNASIKAFQVISGAGVTALTGLASKGLEGADQLAQYNAQIVGMANSTRDANTAMSQAVSFFQENPFDRFSTVAAVKNLMTFNKEIANAEDGGKALRHELDLLGVASLSSGQPIDELASKWGEVSSQARIGKGQFEELASRLPALYDAVGKKMGITGAEVSDSLNRVGIDTKIVREAMEDLYGLDTHKLNLPKESKEFQEYFNSLTGAARQSAEAYLAFSNTLARQTDRVNGKISKMAQALVGYSLDVDGGFQAVEGGIYQSVINLKKAFADAFSTEGGEKFLASLEKIGQKIAPIIDKISSKIPAAIEKLADVLDFLGDHIDFLLPILGGALTLFGGMASKIPIVGDVIGKLTGPLGKVVEKFTEMNPLLQFILMFLGAGAFKALKDGKLNGPLNSIFQSLQRIFDVLKPVVEQVLTIFANIGETVVISLLESLAKVLEVLAGVLEKIPPEVLTGIVMGILGFRAITSVAGPIMQTVKNFKTLKDSITSLFAVKSQALGGVDKIKQILGISGVEKEATKAAESMSGAAGSVSNVSQSATSMNSSLSKVDKVLNSIMKGAGAVILIAGAIAAMAAALKIAYELIPDDFLLLVEKLGIMAAAITAFGLIGFAIDKVNIKPQSLLEMVGIAGIVALTAASLWAVNQLIPDDFGVLIPKLVMIAAVIAAIGVLAFVAGLGFEYIAAGLIAVAGIAADLALVGVALGVANAMIPDDVGKLYEKLGAMAVAIIGMGVLSAAIGALMMTGIGAAAMAVGLATVAALCGEIILCATAIAAVNALVPDDISKTKEKVESITDVINHMASQNFGNLFKNLLSSWSLAPLTEIAAQYARIAKCLNAIADTNIEKDKVKKKVELITEVVETISNTGPSDFAGKIKSAVKNFVQMIDTAIISHVVNIYYDIAKKLNEIQNVELDNVQIIGKITLIKGIVEQVGSTKEGDFGKTLENTAKLFLEMIDTKIVSEMVNVYYDIAQKLNEIQNVELNKETIDQKIQLLAEIVQYVGGQEVIPSAGKNIFELLYDAASLAIQSNAAENAGKVVNVYADVIKSLESIEKFEMDDTRKENIKKQLNNMGEILKVVLDTKGDGGVFGAIGSFFAGGSITEEQVAKIQSIINKFTEIAKTLNGMQDIDVEGNKDKITHIRDCIYEIGQINEVKSMGNKEWIVGMSLSILYKMNELVGLLNSIPDVSDAKKDQMIKIRGIIYEICQINEGVGDIGNKENIVNTATNIVNKMIEFGNALNSVPDVDDGKFGMIQKFIDLINTSIASLISDLNSKLTEFESIGSGIVTSLYNGVQNSVQTLTDAANFIHDTIFNTIDLFLGEGGNFYLQGQELVVQFIKGMASMKPYMIEAGKDVQGTIWSAIEPKLKDEYYQGAALAQNLIDGFKSKQYGDDSFYSAGANAVQGFINGANSKNVYSVGWNIASSYLSGLKDKGQQGSPWKTTYKSGVWAVEGMIDGIEKMSYKLEESASDLAETVIDALDLGDLTENMGLSKLSDISLSMSGQKSGSVVPAVGAKQNTINIYNNNYSQGDFNKMSKDIMFNISRL